MSEQTKIEWATSSWNPWIGCTKVSPGCAHCYAENSTPTRVARKNGRELWGKGNERQRTSAAYWKEPLGWNRRIDKDFSWLCPKCGTISQKSPYTTDRYCPHTGCDGLMFQPNRPRIFPSLCDWLDDEVPIEWLADFCRLMMQTPNLDWLLLSKRPENWSDRLHAAMRTIHDAADDWISGWLDGVPPANVWIGTSVEDQTRADERIPELLRIPAMVRFLSVEPMLGPINFKLVPRPIVPGNPDGHWVIVGGESGHGARSCRVDWIRSIVDQCAAAKVPCFVKQMGANVVGNEMDRWVCRMKHKKGGDVEEWPRELRVRQFPLSQEATHRATDGPH